jgi:hypothetical protein
MEEIILVDLRPDNSRDASVSEVGFVTAVSWSEELSSSSPKKRFHIYNSTYLSFVGNFSFFECQGQSAKLQFYLLPHLQGVSH